ncbi:hypothetical protein TrRE_jg12567, partial [Triparma retinervis]
DFKAGVLNLFNYTTMATSQDMVTIIVNRDP